MFEFLVLETFQAGLSWITVLRKREEFRAAFDQFSPERIARYDKDKIEDLVHNAGIIRHRAKIIATVANAKAFLETVEKFGSFSRYLWAFNDHRILVNQWNTLEELPARTALSDAIAKDMKRRGFRFVGSTVIYAYLQAIGMVNDHLVSCFRHREIQNE